LIHNLELPLHLTDKPQHARVETSAETEAEGTNKVEGKYKNE